MEVGSTLKIKEALQSDNSCAQTQTDPSALEADSRFRKIEYV